MALNILNQLVTWGSSYRLCLYQLVARITVYPMAPIVHNETLPSLWDHLPGNRRRMSCQSNENAVTPGALGRNNKQEKLKLGVDEVLNSGTWFKGNSLLETNHLEYLQYLTSIHAYLTSGQMRVKCYEPGFSNSYLSSQVSLGHYVALSRLLRTA